MNAVDEAPVRPLEPSLRPLVLPEIAVKILLGAGIRRVDGEAWVTFEGEPVRMSVQDFEFASRVAARLRARAPSRITPGTLLGLVGLAQQYVAEELFRPGAVRVLFYSTMSKASAFYRCLMPMYALNMGSRVTAHASKGKFGREALDYDVVVFQIDNSPATQEFARTLQGMGKRVVYEIDDAFDCLESWHPQWASYGQPARQEAIRAMMSRADAVQVSTSWLADRYRPRTRRIEVVPNLVELAAWPRAERLRQDGAWKILWAGSPSHSGDLELVIPALGRFARAHPDVRIVFFGQTVRDERIPAGQIETVDWCEFEEYPFRLAGIDADVAVAPLADIPFNAGKSNLRILQMWATGYPVVASRTGPYAAAIENGQNGLLADGEDEWVRALESLYRNGEACRAFANAGAEAVKIFDVITNARQVEDFYASLVDRR